jgi:hypothetical protein
VSVPYKDSEHTAQSTHYTSFIYIYIYIYIYKNNNNNNNNNNNHHHHHHPSLNVCKVQVAVCSEMCKKYINIM